MPASSLKQSTRIWLLFFGSLGLFSLIGMRLFDLQVVRSSYFEAVAASQRQRSSELAPSRGTIYVSEGREGELFPVATNQQTWIVYAIPRNMDDPAHVAQELAPALSAFRERQRARSAAIIAETGQGRSLTTSPTPSPEPTPQLSSGDETAILRDQLYAKFNQRTDPYEPLIKPYEIIDEELKKFVEEKKLPGIALAERETRIYPERSLGAHVLGYVGWSEDGQTGRYGIEEHFNQSLAGNLGWLFTERDTKGELIGVASRQFQAPQNGADIVLTIDRVIQSFIEEELRDGVERFGAVRGSVVVMNPKTGAILGMATYPTFDPNHYYAITDPRIQTNPVVSDLFEPGSILKPVVMAAAIEDKAVTPESTFQDKGPVRVDKYTIDTYDGRHWGTQTMTQILEQSNNVGMVSVAQKLGAQVLYDYLRRFGIGEKTGIEIAGEANSTLPPPREWNIATVATVGFGQGMILTPLQALNAINVVANRGILMQPYVVSRIRQSDGREETHQPTSVHQTISAETANQVGAMMVSVIENGVATLARVPGYYLAGKTGTAQVSDPQGGYSKTEKIISFTGFGPVSDPQFSILVKLDNPSGLSFASGTAAPMFRNIAEKILQYYQVPPDYDPAQKPKPFSLPKNSNQAET